MVQCLTILRIVLLVTGEGGDGFFAWTALFGALVLSEGAGLGRCDKIVIRVGWAQGLAA